MVADDVVHVLWRAEGVDGSEWHEPVPLTESISHPVPPGAHLSAVHQPSVRTLAVLFVDARGALRALSKRDNEAWGSPPQRLSSDGFAPAGAPVAAIHYAGHDQLEAVVGGHDALWLVWRVGGDGWQGPIALTEPGSGAPAAPVSAAHQPPAAARDDVAPPDDGAAPPGDTLAVAAGDPVFLGRVIWKDRNGFWRPCALPIVRRAAAPAPDVRTDHVMQVTGGPEWVAAGVPGTDLGANTEHRGEHWVFFGDVPRFEPGPGPPHDADVVARVTSMSPESVKLSPVLGNDGLFAPLAIRRPDGIFVPQTVQTPTGAFSDGDRAYVFVLVHEGPNGEPVPRPVPGGKVVSYLTASPDPGAGEPYELVFRWAEERFWQVAPWVVRDPGAVGLSADVGEGVALLGHGFQPGLGDAVHLAWLPLPLAPDARSSVRYCDGATPDPRQWSPDLAAARALWLTPGGYTAVSLAWLAAPPLGRPLLEGALRSAACVPRPPAGDRASRARSGGARGGAREDFVRSLP